MTNSNTVYILNKMENSTNINIKEIKDYLKSLIEKNPAVEIYQDNATLHESNIDKVDFIHVIVLTEIYEQTIVDLKKIKDNTSKLRIVIEKYDGKNRSGIILEEINPNFE